MAIASTSKEKTNHVEQPEPAMARQDSEPGSDTSSVQSGEVSGRKDGDILVLSPRSEEYRLLFRLPPDEVLIQDFNCALQENILLQGHMYLFIHHICFYSNIFGFETKKTISLQQVTCVRKAKTAAIFPNAIEIVAGGKKHFFASFLSRDEAYRLIIDGWAMHNCDLRTILDRQESKSEVSSEYNCPVSEKPVEFTQITDETLSSYRDDSIAEGSRALYNGKGNKPDAINLIEVEENREVCNDHEPSAGFLTWLPEDVDAPKVPEHFTMVAEAKFLVRVEDFFRHFFSDSSLDFLEKFHQKCGDKDFCCTRWQQLEQFGHERDLSFLHPVKITIGSKFGHCKEVQKLHIYRNRHLVINTTQQISNVPFGEYFTVEGIWDVKSNAEEGGCILRVYSYVAFSKKTMFKGKIEQSTKEECREVYALWISMTYDLLQETDAAGLEILHGASEQSRNYSQTAIVNSTKVHEPTEMSQTEPAMLCSPILYHASGSNSQNDSPAWEILGFITDVFSNLRSLWGCAFSYLRRQGILLPVVFLAFAAVLVLLQIGVIILLTRGPKVHIVTLENHGNMEWLEKRFSYLKEEMLVLEARMEDMRNEYVLLKGLLDDCVKLRSNI